MAEIGINSSDVAPAVIRQQGLELNPIYLRAIKVLTFGFRIGGSLLCVGLLVALVRQESLRRITESYLDVVPSIVDGEASGIVSLAIIVLVATPVVTVLNVALGFFGIGDRRFGLLSLVVLAVLAVSISLSLFR